MSLIRRRVAAAALVAVAATLAALLPQTSADATSYRFWIYWTGGSGDWSFSSQGASRRPPDGTVEGWRFAISEEVGSSSAPRLSSSFQQICGSTDPVEGKKRVGLVIDFGTAADSPPGDNPPEGPVARCVVAPTTATGYDILASVTSLRVDEGLVCGVAGYPSSGCGEVVRSPKPTKSPDNQPPKNSGSPSPPNADSIGSNESADADGGGPSSADQGNSKTTNTERSAQQKTADKPAADERDEAIEQDDDAAAVLAASNNSLPTNNQGSPAGTLIGAALVALLLAAAVWLTRRRRNQS